MTQAAAATKKPVQLDLVDRGPPREHPTPMLVEEWSSKVTTVSGNSALVNYRELPLNHTFRPGHAIVECPRCKQRGEAKVRVRAGQKEYSISSDASRVVHSVEVVNGRSKVRSSCRLT